MMKLVHTGKHLHKCNASKMPKYGKLLQQAFSNFVQDFIPHMEKEEKVFQVNLFVFLKFYLILK